MEGGDLPPVACPFADGFRQFIAEKWSDWFENKLDQLLKDEFKALEYNIFYGFIVDKNGKVSDGRIIRASDYPEINAVFEKMLTQIPDWKPAMRGGKAVSVFYREWYSHRIRNAEKK